jgi:hypothetical protein
MRMGRRRSTRLTKAFSKKVENLAHAASLHYMHYNFARPAQDAHQRTTTIYPTSPAIAAGVADYVWSIAEIAWPTELSHRDRRRLWEGAGVSVGHGGHSGSGRYSSS